MAEKKKAKGLVPMKTKSGEIMWVNPDIIKDKQWESSKPKLKDKSCNAVSFVTNDDAVTIASLSDSKEEKLVLAVQPATSQPISTRSGRMYLWQYARWDTMPTTLGTTAPVQASAPSPPLDKEKQKRSDSTNHWRMILQRDSVSFSLQHIGTACQYPTSYHSVRATSPYKGDKRGA